MVGTCCIDVIDNERIDTLGKNNEKRKISIRFYYPGEDEGNKKKAILLTEKKKKEFRKDADFTLYDSRISVYENLKMREGSFPLILFSHGYTAFSECNSDLCQYLSEHGYIAASVSHTYEAIETVFTDGSTAAFKKSLYFKMFSPLIPGLMKQSALLKKELTAQEALKEFDSYQARYSQFMTKRIKEWAKDGCLAIKKIHELNEDQSSFFYHKVDFSGGVGSTGHSFGGAEAYYHCIYNDEISCGINIDGGLFGDYGDRINHKPFAQIIGENNANVVSRSRLYHDAPAHYIQFKDMKHVGFTDMKLVNKKEDLVGKADPVAVFDTLNEIHLAFFDRYLKNKDITNRELLVNAPDVLKINECI